MARIHDRQATELPANAVVRPIIVDDPYEKGATIVALQSLRDDPLSRLYAVKAIDVAQYNAGREMQGYYEQAEVGNVKAMDPTKEPVDGGGYYPEPVTDAMKRAANKIAKVEAALGREGAALVRAVLIHRIFLNQIARSRAANSERENRYVSRRFRECMETVAVELGFAERPVFLRGGPVSGR